MTAGDGASRPGGRVAAYGLVLLLTLLAAVWGAFLVPLHVGGAAVPVGLALALAPLPLGLAGARVLGGRGGALGPAAVWLLVSAVAASPRREGDLVVTGSGRGMAFLVVGTLAALAAVGLARPARPQPAGPGARDTAGAARAEP